MKQCKVCGNDDIKNYHQMCLLIDKQKCYYKKFYDNYFLFDQFSYDFFMIVLSMLLSAIVGYFLYIKH